MIGRFRVPDPGPVEESRGFDAFELRLGDVMRGERATMGKSLLDVQRELKIKANYIAAIENADPTAFETPGFIAGYVRSYARYLSLDPEWAYKAFCAEGGFETAHGMSSAASSQRSCARVPGRAANRRRDPFAEPSVTFVPAGPGLFSNVQPGAVGSVMVLLGLIGVIGYGGYTVLNQVQQVQVVPVEQAPEVVAQLDPLTTAQNVAASDEDAGVTAAAPDRFDRLYRPQALDVPVLVARDAPIATLDPRLPRRATPANTTLDNTTRDAAATLLAPSFLAPNAVDTSPVALASAIPGADAAPGADADAPDAGGVQVVAAGAPGVVLFAVRPSWVRVRAADGTVLLEKIMAPGERFDLPRTEEPPTLRTGESGAIYFAVEGRTYGPAGRNGQVTGNLVLAADSLTAAYQVADLDADVDLARVVAELSAPADRTPPGAD